MQGKKAPVKGWQPTCGSPQSAQGKDPIRLSGLIIGKGDYVQKGEERKDTPQSNCKKHLSGGC